MKIFSWFRNRGNGNEEIKKTNPESMHYHMKHESCKEEFSDWPNGLLAIGTFGNTNLKQSEKLFTINQDHHVDINTTSEDNNQFDKELKLLLSNHISVDPEKQQNLSVQELLDYLLQDESKSDLSENKGSIQLQRNASRKEIRSDNKKRGIGKKSLSFLIKKAFLCRGGFGPSPILWDPLPDLKLDHSRMDKILRAMLHKKIYPQSQRPTPKKCLDMAEIDEFEEEQEEGNHESKWVKTDSEYIVLEI